MRVWKAVSEGFLSAGEYDVIVASWYSPLQERCSAVKEAYTVWYWRLTQQSAGKPHILVKIGQRYLVSNMKTYVDSSINCSMPRHCEGNTVLRFHANTQRFCMSNNTNNALLRNLGGRVNWMPYSCIAYLSLTSIVATTSNIYKALAHQWTSAVRPRFHTGSCNEHFQTLGLCHSMSYCRTGKTSFRVSFSTFAQPLRAARLSLQCTGNEGLENTERKGWWCSLLTQYEFRILISAQDRA